LFLIRNKALTLKVYRIDKGIFGKIVNTLKKADLPTAKAATAPSMGNFLKNVSDYRRDESYVLSKDDEINRFTEAYGDEFIDDKYYVRHPKKIKTDYLIPADKFHQYIIREQISDMIDYMRSNLRIKELEINILRQDKGKVGLKGILEGLSLSGETTLDIKTGYTAKIKCTRPLKASEKKQTYTWIDEFPHLISIVDDAVDGEFSLNEKFDFSFGLSAKVADAYGMNLDWNTSHAFEFKVVVG